MKQFPCINPACSHLFSAAELSGLGVKCPRCGQKIQMHTAAASSQAPAVPTTKPASKPSANSSASGGARASKPPEPPPVPIAAAPKPAPPVTPAPRAAPPLALPVASVPFPGEPESLTDLEQVAAPRGPTRPRQRSWTRLAAVAFIVLGGALAVVLAVRRFRGPEEDRPLYEGKTTEKEYKIKSFENKDERAFKITLPAEAWKESKDLVKSLDAHAAWWNDDSKVDLIVLASDFGLRKPRDAELIRTGMDLLYRRYEETLETERMPKESRLAGQKAQKLEFKGRHTGAVVQHGELHFFSHRGIGYWVLLAGPDLDACRKSLGFLEEHKLGLALIDARKGWTEQPPPVETFVGYSGTASLTVPEGVYQKQDRPKEKEVEFAADLYLLGRYRKDRDNRKNAHVQLYLLDPELNLDDAMAKARAHVVAAWAGGEGATDKLVLSSEAEEGMGEKGKTIKVGDRSGRIADFAKIVDGKEARLVVIAVVNDASRLYVIACDVVWDNRQIWHQEFHDLATSLRIRKGTAD